MEQMVVTGFIIPSRIFGAVILLPGIVLSGAAIWFLFSTAAFVREANSVPGIVVDLKPSSGENGGPGYYAVFEFTDTDGAKHQATTNWASSPPAYSVGEHVTILYSPRNTADARVSGFLSLWLTTIIFCAVAAGNMVFVMVFLWLVPFTIHRVWPASRPAAP